MASLSQLDQDLKQLSLNDVVALNQLGEKHQLEKKARNDIVWFVLMNGLAMFIISLLHFDGILMDYLQVGLALITMTIGFLTYRRGGQSALLGIASVMGLWAIYYLLIANILQGEINGRSVILGTLQVLLALFYIQKANHFASLQEKTSNLIYNDLYDALYETLSNSKANSSNQLLELQEIMQTITVWLRQPYSVILLKGEKRLFFDTTQSFTMTIKGQDRGGDTLKVDASIIDRMRVCSISRHGWLRYIQYSR